MKLLKMLPVVMISVLLFSNIFSFAKLDSKLVGDNRATSSNALSENETELEDEADFALATSSNIQQEPEQEEELENDIFADEELLAATPSNSLDYFDIDETTLYGYFGDDSVVYIPETVTDIAEEAFMGDEMIEELFIPESVQSIGIQAFADMASLRKIHFAGVPEADFVDIFMDSTAITEFDVLNGTESFFSKDGILYAENNDIVSAYYPSAKEEKEYVIPEGTATVFLNGNKNVAGLEIPSSVSRIDFYIGSDRPRWADQIRNIKVAAENNVFTIDEQGNLTDKNNGVIIYHVSGDKEAEQ